MAQDRHRPLRNGAARTRARLLVAAAEVFAERGYAGASVDDIAGAAGVSVGSIYSRFGSKQELFEALMSEHLARDVARVRDGMAVGLAEGISTPDDILHEAAGSRRRTLLDAETWVSAMRTPALRHALAEHETAARHETSRTFAEQRRHIGVDIGMSDEEFATVVTALYQGLLRQVRLDPDVVAPDLLGRVLMTLVRGLAAETGDATPRDR